MPNLDYTDMEIQDGAAASIAYTRMIAEDTPESEKTSIGEALLTYCAQDTEAMVHVYDALRDEAENSELR